MPEILDSTNIIPIGCRDRNPIYKHNEARASDNGKTASQTPPQSHQSRRNPSLLEIRKEYTRALLYHELWKRNYIWHIPTFLPIDRIPDFRDIHGKPMSLSIFIRLDLYILSDREQ
ncbi:hypothetical protein D3C78_1450890 [compost metagenome]